MEDFIHVTADRPFAEDSLETDFVLIQSKSKLEQYSLIKPLTKDRSSSVQLACHIRTGQIVALKFVTKSEGARMEGIIQKHMLHPNIATIYDIFETYSHVVLVQEYLSGGDLFELVPQNGFSETEALLYIDQIASAIAYLHSRDYAHRDIKPENCARGANGEIKLIDFGAASHTRSIKNWAGTVPYMSPELILQNGAVDAKAVDVYALGITLFTLPTARFPWRIACKTVSKDFRCFLSGEFLTTLPWSNFSPSMVNLLCGMLSINVVTRFSVYDVQKEVAVMLACRAIVDKCEVS